MAADLLNLGLLFDEPDFFLLAGLLYEEEDAQKHVHPARFDFDNVTEEQSWLMFRFNKNDIRTLHQKLRIPKNVNLENGSVVSGIDALCMFLRRMAYPGRLVDLAHFFGRAPSDISRTVNFVLCHIYDNFGQILETLDHQFLSIPNLQLLAQSVRNKGSPFEHCWGFIDGTVMQICRPKEHQRQLYSGHKRVHCLKFQSVMCPNGIISSFMGPYIGRRHDAGMFHESMLLRQLENKVDADGTPFFIYGDSAYPLSRFVMTPYKGANVTEEQHNFNKVMSSHRICVEWGFADITKTFAFLDFKKNLKLHLQPLGKLYKVAVILMNCRCCLYGNQTSQFFGINPPTIDGYLS